MNFAEFLYIDFPHFLSLGGTTVVIGSIVLWTYLRWRATSVSYGRVLLLILLSKTLYWISIFTIYPLINVAFYGIIYPLMLSPLGSFFFSHYLLMFSIVPFFLLSKRYIPIDKKGQRILLVIMIVLSLLEQYVQANLTTISRMAPYESVNLGRELPLERVPQATIQDLKQKGDITSFATTLHPRESVLVPIGNDLVFYLIPVENEDDWRFHIVPKNMEYSDPKNDYMQSSWTYFLSRSRPLQTSKVTDPQIFLRPKDRITFSYFVNSAEREKYISLNSSSNINAQGDFLKSLTLGLGVIVIEELGQEGEITLRAEFNNSPAALVPSTIIGEHTLKKFVLGSTDLAALEDYSEHKIAFGDLDGDQEEETVTFWGGFLLRVYKWTNNKPVLTASRDLQKEKYTQNSLYKTLSLDIENERVKITLVDNCYQNTSCITSAQVTEYKPVSVTFLLKDGLLLPE